MMLDIDYTLKTTKGVKIQTDVPLDEMKHIDGNIMLVQSPSSMGKSTVMNMIALGCFGDTDQSLSQSVRTDISELATASYRDLRFDITLSDRITGKSLHMSKKSGKKDIVVTEEIDGSTSYLTPDSFRKKYNLIYDVPEDPTKRLEQIRDALKDDHREVDASVESLLGDLKEKRRAIISVPTVENIDSKRKELESDQIQIEIEQDKFGSIKEKRTAIDCLIKCKEYDLIVEEIDSYNKKLKFEQSKKIIPESGEDRRADAIRKYREQVPSIMIKSATRTAIRNSRNQELINKLKEIDSISLDDHKNVPKYSSKISELKSLIPSDLENSEAVSQLRLVNDLITFLKNKDQDLSLGSLGNVGDVISSLEMFKESESLRDSFDYSSIRKDIASITPYLLKVGTAADKIDKAEDAPAAKGQNPELVKQYKSKIKESTDKKDIILNYLRDKGIAITQITEEEFKFCKTLDITITTKIDELKSLKEEIDSQFNSQQRTVETIGGRINRNREAIENYDKMELPPYYEYKSEINKIIDACTAIRSCIRNADSRLSKVIDHDDSEFKKNKDLYQNMWDYIGYKLGTVRDCGTTYEVSSVNLLDEGKGSITTKEGVVVPIGAMGTGEGQLSYLKGLLSTGDDRMIIALFDEVGNMSNNLLTALTEDFVKLQQQGKLMLAFMARPTSDVFEVKLYD